MARHVGSGAEPRLRFPADGACAWPICAYSADPENASHTPRCGTATRFMPLLDDSRVSGDNQAQAPAPLRAVVVAIFAVAVATMHYKGAEGRLVVAIPEGSDPNAVVGPPPPRHSRHRLRSRRQLHHPRQRRRPRRRGRRPRCRSPLVACHLRPWRQDRPRSRRRLGKRPRLRLSRRPGHVRGLRRVVPKQPRGSRWPVAVSRQPSAVSDERASAGDRPIGYDAQVGRTASTDG